VVVTDSNGNWVLHGGLLTTKPLAHGINQLSAADFSVAGFTGNYNQAIMGDLSNLGQDPTKVQQFLTKRYTICLYPWICGVQYTPSSSQPPNAGRCGNSVCQPFQLMGGSTVVDTIAILLYPHNQPVSGLPFFLFTPAISSSIPADQISYELDVFEDHCSDQPYARVSIPAGASTSYQWKGSDKQLDPTKQYCWTVVSIGPNGKPFGGPGNRGWNICKCFTFANIEGKSRVDLICAWNQLKTKLPADIAAKISNMMPDDIEELSGAPETADLCEQLKSGKTSIEGFEFTKN
jgi:hypothetical protein